MKNVINLRFNKNRHVVLNTIRQHLYPEEEYSRKLFPDLPSVLFNRFMDVVKSKPDLKKIYRDPGNEEDVRRKVIEMLEFKALLSNHPETVVLLYRSCIKKFIQYKHSGADEWEDIYQEVMARLISGKIHRIKEKFDFSYSFDEEKTGTGNNQFIKKSSFTSYLMVSVRNIYMDIIRERNVRPLTGGGVLPIEDVFDMYEEDNMLERLVIEEEFQKFKMVLALFYNSRPKLELCLKLKCRIPLAGNDIRLCFPACAQEDIDTLSRDFKGLKDKKVFDIVVPVFNRNEERENKSDTLRKWISVKIDEMVAHMNQTHSHPVYTGKSFVDFVTLYYERAHEELQLVESEKNVQQETMIGIGKGKR